MRPPRVLHAPLNIANDPWIVSRAERALGVRSDLAVVRPPAFSFDADIDLSSPQLGPFRRNIRKVAFAAKAMRVYDVFHYCFATSILDYRRLGLGLADMRVAARLRKPIVMTFHGCDVRAARPGGCAVCARSCDSSEVRRRLDAVRRCADILYVKTPDLLAAVPEATYVPQAVDTTLWPLSLPAPSGPLRVVHAPTDRRMKGTQALLDACDRLVAGGHALELILVEGVDHDRAAGIYESADIAVDQLIIGWYGVFAIEMMSMGKPTIAHIESVALAGSGIDALPIVNADRTTIYEALLWCIENRSSLQAIGQRSRDFVVRHHSADRIASRLIEDYARISRSRAVAWPVTYP